MGHAIGALIKLTIGQRLLGGDDRQGRWLGLGLVDKKRVQQRPRIVTSGRVDLVQLRQLGGRQQGMTQRVNAIFRGARP